MGVDLGLRLQARPNPVERLRGRPSVLLDMDGQPADGRHRDELDAATDQPNAQRSAMPE